MSAESDKAISQIDAKVDELSKRVEELERLSKRVEELERLPQRVARLERLKHKTLAIGGAAAVAILILFGLSAWEIPRRITELVKQEVEQRLPEEVIKEIEEKKQKAIAAAEEAQKNAKRARKIVEALPSLSIDQNGVLVVNGPARVTRGLEAETLSLSNKSLTVRYDENLKDVVLAINGRVRILDSDGLNRIEMKAIARSSVSEDAGNAYIILNDGKATRLQLISWGPGNGFPELRAHDENGEVKHQLPSW
ncbi:hypothetical protein [Stratiformator vulcanicus]|uniref:Uncharacterized protein n=1 Tax=Stratiformator vulcanicus TaxID=2527980 RepID=A0A517R742_9PLAN|nr:hypothetical protein [Stratiformator vulcanicus]QDT39700.1 hypothetical protein Pan189_41090 [Stratiformator vulcanicus]